MPLAVFPEWIETLCLCACEREHKLSRMSVNEKTKGFSIKKNFKAYLRTSWSFAESFFSFLQRSWFPQRCLPVTARALPLSSKTSTLVRRISASSSADLVRDGDDQAGRRCRKGRSLALSTSFKAFLAVLVAAGKFLFMRREIYFTGCLWLCSPTNTLPFIVFTWPGDKRSLGSVLIWSVVGFWSCFQVPFFCRVVPTSYRPKFSYHQFCWWLDSTLLSSIMFIIFIFT